jgi:hypothetical protein
MNRVLLQRVKTTETRTILAHCVTRDVPTPPMELIKSMVDAFVGAPICYTIDIAMKPDGEAVLMECNDAWAIGLYDKCMTSAEYYDFLKSRWSQILSQLTQSQQFGME